MLFRVFILLSLYAATAHSQDFVCGYGLGEDGVIAASSEEIASYSSSSSTDPIYVLPLFGKFKNQKDPMDLNNLLDRDGKKTQSSANLLDLDHKGSLAHFFYEMSYRALALAIHASDRNMLGMWLESKSVDRNPYFGKTSTNPATEADCHSTNPRRPPENLDEWRNALRTFSREILEAADESVEFNNYDNDNDGRVDLVVAVFNPAAFSQLCGPNGTVFSILYTTNDHIGGDTSKANIWLSARVITGDHSKSFPYLVGLMAHEYGHVIGLPELYDRTNIFNSSATIEHHSAGIGYYGAMGKGNNGYATKKAGVVDGPAPLSEWSRIELGWIKDSPTATDDRLDTVAGDMDLSIHDINSDNGKVYKIPVLGKTSEYFLLSNRQNTYDDDETESSVGSYYDEYAPTSGLLIYHVDDTVTGNDRNIDEEHKGVDVECADGLRRDQATSTADPVNFIDDDEAGGDDLDYWTGESDKSGKDYLKSRRGNIGDEADVWTTGEFTPYTNPSTDGYDGMGTAKYTDDEQTKFTGIAIRNITQNANGSVSVKIRFIPSAPEVDKTSLRQGTGEKWNEVSLSWPEPTNASAIGKYQYSIDENTDWQDFSSSPTGTSPVTGTIALSATNTKVDYTFRVRAVNEQTAPDPDEVSAPSAEVTFTLDRPGQVTLTSSGTLATPTVGDVLTATPADPNMSESAWDDVSWQWQRRIVGVPWTGANISGATNASYTLTAEDGGHEVRATVRYNDAVGDEDMAASVPVAVPDAPPSANGETSLATDENIDSNTTGPVDLSIYTNTDPNPNAPVWSLTGADADYFNLVQTSSNAAHERTLQFKQPPNYEVPLEGGGYKTTYAVGVKVADAPLSGAAGAEGDALSAILSVTVTVTNVEEAGSVVLSPLPPQVGVALVARLTDPDEGLTFTGASWTWHRRADEASDWEPVPTGAVGATTNYPELSSYTPQMADVGYQLQATVRYDDHHGPDKCAASTPTVAVVSSNRPPVLTGFAEAWVSEGRIRVTTYRARDPDKDSLVWSLGGTDAAAFELFGSGQARTLRLQAAADFEQQATYSLTVGVSDGSRSATLDVTVRVKNIEEAGRVALISTQPQVGTPLTATLSDPDGSITGAAWQWQRRVDDTADWEDVAAGVAGTSGVAELSSYTPQAGDVGFMLQATVRYRDGHSNATKTAESGATEAVVGPPVAVASLTAVPGDGQVVLGWQAPASDGGEPISGYEYRQSKDGGTTWQPDWMAIADSDAETTGHTVEDLTNDTAYTFAVRAVNAVGAGAARRAMATPVSSNQPPELMGPAEASVSEGRTKVTTYRASDPDRDRLVWSLTGADAAFFALLGSGRARTLELKAPPDFERQATYTLTVEVSDGSLVATLDVTVRVSNEEEAGRVALPSTPPQVGTPLTATLSDPDGSITGAVWQWQRRVDDTAAWADVSAGVEGTSGVAELSSYTPAAVDVGFMLRATVRYRDGYTTRVKTAESAATEAVVGPPAVLASLTAAPGDGQVVLTWPAPASDGGEPITGYEYRQSEDGGTNWKPDWTAIKDSDDETTGHTISGLTNDTAYTVAVRAVNKVGTGPARAVTATPVQPNQSPTLQGPETATVAENSTGTVGPYEASDPNNDELTWSLRGADAAAFELTGTGNTRSLAFQTPPDFEQQSSYAVSVSVDDGALSATVTTTISVANIDEAGTVALSSTAPQVGVPLTATLSDPDGGVTNLRWRWLSFRAGVTGQGEEVPAALGIADGQTATLTPTRALVETRIQARALYVV